MIKLWATLIINGGGFTLSDVPVKSQPAVQTQLAKMGFDDDGTPIVSEQ